LTIKSTKYNTGYGKEIKIPYGMQFEIKDTSGTLKTAKIPWEPT
jgi:hypothetical protein